MHCRERRPDRPLQPTGGGHADEAVAWGSPLAAEGHDVRLTGEAK